VVVFGSISAFASYKNSIKLRILSKEDNNMFDDFNGVVADSISNALNVKANGSEDYEISFVKKFFNKHKTARLVHINKYLDGTRIQQTMVCLFEIFAMLLIVKLWYQNEISIGDVTLGLILMNTIMSIFTKVLENISELNAKIGALQAAMMPFVVKHEIVDAPKAKKLKVSGGAIEFKNVKFGYDKKKVFNNLSLKIKAKEKVGLVGVSGSGKSTLINLLQRAYDVEAGEILIDGQNIAKVKQGSLHDAISLIPQDTALFHRTVSQNIAYGDLKAKQSEIETAAKKAYADEFIKGLPKGYQTKVGEKGVKLSGGQRQRVAIARAILKNSPILILDEATSALDSEAEKYIQKAMKNLIKNKTVIAIAHRLSTLKEMDRIIVLDKGKIVEEGTMKELLARGGEFQHLWEIQNKE
jgi:ATP-binding cassette subfamily B protein